MSFGYRAAFNDAGAWIPKPVKFDALGENGAAAAFVFQWQDGSFGQVLPTGTSGSVSILATKPPWTS